MKETPQLKKTVTEKIMTERLPQECDIERFKALAIMQKCQITSNWDFNTSLGNTLREKFDSFLAKIIECTNVLVRHRSVGYFWIIMSPEVYSMIEVVTSTHSLDKKGNQEKFVFQDQPNFIGVLNKRWSVFVDQEWPVEQVLIGCGPPDNPEKIKSAKLVIANYIII
jgi:hypothetical protein